MIVGARPVWKFDGVALKVASLAGMPKRTCEWLLATMRTGEAQVVSGIVRLARAQARDKL